MGLTIVATRIDDARRAYDDGKIDGFLAAPSAALAFQWSAAAGYVTDLHSGYLYGCLVFGEPQFQKLPLELQSALRAGAARMLVGIEELGRRQDEQLPGPSLMRRVLQSQIRDQQIGATTDNILDRSAHGLHAGGLLAEAGYPDGIDSKAV